MVTMDQSKTPRHKDEYRGTHFRDIDGRLIEKPADEPQPEEHPACTAEHPDYPGLICALEGPHFYHYSMGYTWPDPEPESYFGYAGDGVIAGND